MSENFFPAHLSSSRGLEKSGNRKRTLVPTCFKITVEKMKIDIYEFIQVGFFERTTTISSMVKYKLRMATHRVDAFGTVRDR